MDRLSSNTWLETKKDDPRIKRNLTVIFFARVASSMGIAVMFSSLALYFASSVQFSERVSAEMIGLFLALHYTLPLLGGYLGNNFIDFKKLYCIGMSIQVAGDLFLAAAPIDFLTFGLAMFLIGSMVSSVSIIMFINDTVGDNDNRRRRAMLWNYCATNIGIFVGYLISGLFGMHHAYRTLFLLLAICPMISVFLISRFLNHEPSHRKKSGKTLIAMVPFIIGAVFVIHLLIQYAAFLRIYVLCLSGLGILYLFVSAFLVDRESRIRLFSLVFYVLIGILFWSVYMLTPTVIMDFMKDHVHLFVNGAEIAPQWLNSVDSIIIITGTPLLAFLLKRLKDSRNIEVSTSTLFFLGMTLAAIGAFFLSHMMIAWGMSNMQVPVFYVAIYIAFLSLGEMCLAPEGQSLPGKLAPKHIRGIAAGVWLSTLGMANVFASFVSDHILGTSKIASTTAYGGVLHQISIMITVAALLALGIGMIFDWRLRATCRR